MDIPHFRQLLLDKQKDLEQQMDKLGTESREADTTDVHDGVDLANASEERSSSLTLAAKEFDLYREVTAALARIEQGTYGKCLACGKEIEAARLEAVPWAAYCLADQAKIEAAEEVTGGPTL